MTFAAATNERSTLRFPTAGVVLFVAVCPMAIRWGGAGAVDQVAQGGLILAIMVFALGFIARPMPIRLSETMLAIIVLLCVLTLAFTIHGTPDGYALLPRVVLFTLAGICVSSVLVTTDRLYGAAKWGGLLTFAAVLVSSLVAGVDLLGGLLDYFTSLNRDALVFRVYRPIYNAFAAGTDTEYVASVGNAISAGLAIFLMAMLARLVTGGRLGWIGWIAITLTGLMLLTLFSATAILAIAVWLVLAGGATLMKRPVVVIVIGFVLVVALLIAAIAGVDVLALITVPLEGDVQSRDHRLDQYGAALEVLEANPLFGVGFINVDRFNIHNLPLFAWVSAGVVGLILVAVMYIGMARMIFVGMVGVTRGAMTQRDMLLIGLPLVFITRTMFGGGGGLPDMASCIAAGLCVALYRWQPARP